MRPGEIAIAILVAVPIHAGALYFLAQEADPPRPIEREIVLDLLSMPPPSAAEPEATKAPRPEPPEPLPEPPPEPLPEPPPEPLKPEVTDVPMPEPESPPPKPTPPGRESPPRPPPPSTPPPPSQGEIDRYFSTVYRRIDAAKRYPKRALRRRLQGRIILRIRLDRSGRLLDTEVIEARSKIFLESSLEAVRKSAPFPPFPDDWGMATVTFDVPLKYRLR